MNYGIRTKRAIQILRLIEEHGFINGQDLAKLAHVTPRTVVYFCNKLKSKDIIDVVKRGPNSGYMKVAGTISLFELMELCGDSVNISDEKICSMVSAALDSVFI